jgi:hypothetical protein
MPSASRSAAATMPEQPQQRTTVSAAATRWSLPDRGNDSASGDGFFAWLGDKLGMGRQRKVEDNMTIVAIPLAVGLSVFVGAIAMRRRRNKPQDPRDRA